MGVIRFDLVPGDEESRRKARDELRHQQRLRAAHSFGWPEIPRRELKFGRLIIHEPTGRIYHAYRGEIIHAQYHPNVAAYYTDSAGEAVFLEQPTGAKTLDEIAEKRAALEQRRAEWLRPRARR